MAFKRSGVRSPLAPQKIKPLLIYFSNAMYIVYILKSKTNNKFYVGQTSNLERRLLYHNYGYSKATKSGIPWELEYSENYKSRSDAVRREKEIKNYKSRSYIKKILGERPD